MRWFQFNARHFDMGLVKIDSDEYLENIANVKTAYVEAQLF